MSVPLHQARLERVIRLVGFMIKATGLLQRLCRGNVERIDWRMVQIRADLHDIVEELRAEGRKP